MVDIFDYDCNNYFYLDLIFPIKKYNIPIRPMHAKSALQRRSHLKIILAFPCCINKQAQWKRWRNARFAGPVKPVFSPRQGHFMRGLPRLMWESLRCKINTFRSFFIFSDWRAYGIRKKIRHKFCMNFLS